MRHTAESDYIGNTIRERESAADAAAAEAGEEIEQLNRGLAETEDRANSAEAELESALTSLAESEGLNGELEMKTEEQAQRLEALQATEGELDDAVRTLNARLVELEPQLERLRAFERTADEVEAEIGEVEEAAHNMLVSRIHTTTASASEAMNRSAHHSPSHASSSPTRGPGLPSPGSRDRDPAAMPTDEASLAEMWCSSHALQEILPKLSARARKLHSALQSTETALRAARSDLLVEQRDKVISVRVLHEEVFNTKSRCDTLQGALRTAESTIDELRGRQDEDATRYQENTQAYQDSVDELRTAEALLLQEASRNEETLTDNMNELERLGARVDDLEDDLSSNEDQVTQLTADLAEAGREMQRMEEEKASLSSIRDELSVQLDEQMRESTRLGEALSDTQHNADEDRRTEGQRERIMIDQNAMLQEKVTMCTARVDELDDLTDKQQRAIRETEAELSAVRAEKETYEEELGRRTRDSDTAAKQAAADVARLNSDFTTASDAAEMAGESARGLERDLERIVQEKGVFESSVLALMSEMEGVKRYLATTLDNVRSSNKSKVVEDYFVARSAANTQQQQQQDEGAGGSQYGSPSRHVPVGSAFPMAPRTPRSSGVVNPQLASVQSSLGEIDGLVQHLVAHGAAAETRLSSHAAKLDELESLRSQVIELEACLAELQGKRQDVATVEAKLADMSNNLRTSAMERDKEREMLRMEVSYLRSQMVDVATGSQRDASKAGNLARELASATGDKAQFERRLAERQARVDALEGESATLRQRLLNTEGQLRVAERKADQEHDTASSLNERLSLAQQATEMTRSQAGKAMDRLTSETTGHASLTRRLEDQLVDARAETKRAEQEADNVKDEMAALERQVGENLDTLTTQYMEACTRADTMERELSSARSGVVSLEGRLQDQLMTKDETRALLDQRNDRIAGLESETVSMTQQLAVLGGSVQDLRAALERAEDTRDRLEAEGTRLTDEKNRIERELLAVYKDNETLKETVSHGSRALSVAQGEHADALRNAADETSAVRSEMSVQIERLRSSSMELTSTLEAKSQRLSSLEAEISETRGQMAHIRAAADESRLEKAQIGARFEVAESELARVRQHVASTEDRLTEKEMILASVQRDMDRVSGVNRALVRSANDTAKAHVSSAASALSPPRFSMPDRGDRGASSSLSSHRGDVVKSPAAMFGAAAAGGEYRSSSSSSASSLSSYSGLAAGAGAAVAGAAGGAASTTNTPRVRIHRSGTLFLGFICAVRPAVPLSFHVPFLNRRISLHLCSRTLLDLPSRLWLIFALFLVLNVLNTITLHLRIGGRVRCQRGRAYGGIAAVSIAGRGGCPSSCSPYFPRCRPRPCCAPLPGPFIAVNPLAPNG